LQIARAALFHLEKVLFIHFMLFFRQMTEIFTKKTGWPIPNSLKLGIFGSPSRRVASAGLVFRFSRTKPAGQCQTPLNWGSPVLRLGASHPSACFQASRRAGRGSPNERESRIQFFRMAGRESLDKNCNI
jgi:hypothetical protein